MEAFLWSPCTTDPSASPPCLLDQLAMDGPGSYSLVLLSPLWLQPAQQGAGQQGGVPLTQAGSKAAICPE